MPEIITIGETMVAFTPDSSGYLRYGKDYQMRIAGAESNLAIGVCKLEHTAGWVSSLGKDEFGHFTRNAVRAEGVDTSRVRFDPDHRTGLMFKQILHSSETSVFYYRENSAASHMTNSLLDKEYLSDCKILHLTGITPVLSKSNEKMVREVFVLAASSNIPVSFDPNIRRKLWNGENHTEMLRELMLQAQIVLLGIKEAEALLGTTDKQEIVSFLCSKGSARYVAIKDGANGAVVATPKECFSIPPCPCHCIDPIGAGDAFNAAFLCGILEERDVRTCGMMGAVAGALATETYGDTEGYPSREALWDTIHHKKQISR